MNHLLLDRPLQTELNNDFEFYRNEIGWSMEVDLNLDQDIQSELIKELDGLSV